MASGEVLVIAPLADMFADVFAGVVMTVLVEVVIDALTRMWADVIFVPNIGVSLLVAVNINIVAPVLTALEGTTPAPV